MKARRRINTDDFAPVHRPLRSEERTQRNELLRSLEADIRAHDGTDEETRGMGAMGCELARSSEDGEELAGIGSFLSLVGEAVGDDFLNGNEHYRALLALDETIAKRLDREEQRRTGRWLREMGIKPDHRGDGLTEWAKATRALSHGVAEPAREKLKALAQSMDQGRGRVPRTGPHEPLEKFCQLVDHMTDPLETGYAWPPKAHAALRYWLVPWLKRLTKGEAYR